ncbi:MAG TPA: hypothetical protein ENK81_03890 [Euryarchaeota archaeon]|nr:hypothetical protein [Euryarchaeota archaeon]
MAISETELDQLLEEMAEDWAASWENSKGKIVKKLREPKRQTKWKKRTLSPNAVKKRRERLIEAVNAGLIEAGLAEVDPAEWAAETISGVQDKTITDAEKEEWKKDVKEYMKVILEAKERFDELELEGEDAVLWWYRNVSKKLKDMKLAKGKKVAAKKPVIVEVG